MAEDGQTKNYMIVATYQDDNKDYRKKLIHFSSAEPLTPEGAYEHLRSHFPEWDKLPEGEVWDWGSINPTTYTSVFVYETKVLADNDVWSRYRYKQIHRRTAEAKQEQRDRDLQNLRRIIDKWGLSPLELMAAMADEEKENE